MSEDAKGISDDRKSSSASSDGKKVTIKSADMKEDLQKEAIRIAIGAFEKHGVEKDVAEYIKKEFDKKHGPTWHCIVGKNFVELIPLSGGRSAPVEMDRFLDSDEFEVAFDVDHPSYANIFEDA